VSKKFWDKLSPAEQTILQDAANEARAYQRQVSREQAQKAVAGLQAAGMEVNELTAAELDRMREKTKPVGERFAAEYDPGMVQLFHSELDRIHAAKN
jgi:TRAP-type transport system periplasmic protein